MAKSKGPAIKPLGDRVLVRRVEAEEMTRGGIVLPDTAREKPREGVVEAVGEGRVLDNGERSRSQLKKGDRILFSSYAGTEVRVGQEEFLVMGEEDVLAVID